MKHIHGVMLAVLSLLTCIAVAAAQDLGSLKGLSDSPSGSSLVSGSAGNAAGIIEFCIKNNYLNADAATEMKDRLLAKTGLAAAGNDDGDEYEQGARGLLSSPDGKTIDLAGRTDRLKKKIAQKACESVLNHADSLL